MKLIASEKEVSVHNSCEINATENSSCFVLLFGKSWSENVKKFSTLNL